MKAAIFTYLLLLLATSANVKGGEKLDSGGAGNVKGNTYPFLDLLFSEIERKDIQLYLQKDYHAVKRREDVQIRARQFFKELMKWENQRALKENNQIRHMFRGDRGRKTSGDEDSEDGNDNNNNGTEDNRGSSGFEKRERPLDELIEYLERAT